MWPYFAFIMYLNVSLTYTCPPVTPDYPSFIDLWIGWSSNSHQRDAGQDWELERLQHCLQQQQNDQRVRRREGDCCLHPSSLSPSVVMEKRLAIPNIPPSSPPPPGSKSRPVVSLLVMVQMKVVLFVMRPKRSMNWSVMMKASTNDVKMRRLWGMRSLQKRSPHHHVVIHVVVASVTVVALVLYQDHHWWLVLSLDFRVKRMGNSCLVVWLFPRMDHVIAWEEGEFVVGWL